MKRIFIDVDDSAYECLLGVLNLCEKVEVVSAGEELTFSTHEDCFIHAMKELLQRRVFRYPCDYSYVMMALNEELCSGMPFFYTPMDFIDYMKSMGFDGMPGKTTIYDTVNKTCGRFPNWTFRDHPKPTEAVRRKNIVSQLMSAFGRAKRGISEGLSEKR